MWQLCMFKKDAPSVLMATHYFLLKQIRKTQVNQGASVACTKKLITVKARRDTYGATGHAHINTASFLSHCTTIVTIFSFL